MDRAKIIAAALTPPPVKAGITHWSLRLLADHLSGRLDVLRTWRYDRASGLDGRSFSTPQLIASIPVPPYGSGQLEPTSLGG